MKEKTNVLLLNEKNTSTVVKVVSSSLLKGNICVIPTDTIYGIVALDSYPESVNRIYEIKKRPAVKPFIRLIGSLDNLSSYTEQEVPDPLRKYWPGPLTIIFRDFQHGTVSIRYPDDAFLHSLFRVLDYKVIVAPSANISGEDNIYECSELIETFKGKVSTIVCLKTGRVKKEVSTIIDISGPEWKIIREGALHIELQILQE